MIGTATADIHRMQQETSAREGRRLRQEAAAEYLGWSESTLEKKRLTGDGPPYIKLSTGRVVYDTRDLDQWLDERRVTSTSQTAPAATPGAIQRPRSTAQSRQEHRKSSRSRSRRSN
jgi:predicted DNA-binding transcriptional regulator AlpA